MKCEFISSTNLFSFLSDFISSLTRPTQELSVRSTLTVLGMCLAFRTLPIGLLHFQYDIGIDGQRGSFADR